MEKPVQELLPLVQAAQQQVTEIRGSAQQLMEAITFAGDESDINAAVAKLAKATAGEITQLQALGRELDGTLQKAKAVPATGGAQEDGYVKAAAGQKRWALAAAAFSEHIQGFGALNPAVWDALEQPRKRACANLEDRQAGAKLLDEVVGRVQGVVGGAGVQVQLRNEADKAAAAGEAVEVRVTCEDVICAVVTLAGPGQPEPVRVVTFAATESAIHAWGFSNFLVFRRVSAVATRALYFFLSRSKTAAASAMCAAAADSAQQAVAYAGAHALEDLLLWLCTYTDLFSRKCCATDCLLAADLTSQLLLPPLLRPYKLSPAELRDAAAYPHRRRAYHLHAAPYTLL
eukprot:jgi/Tetstr1/440680/TSEL_028989.t1